MLALNPIHQEPYKPPFYSVKFANGSIMSYGEAMSPKVKTKSGTHEIDLQGFLNKRIANRKSGDPDKSGNDLEYQRNHGGVGAYLFQVVPISPARAIALIGYRCGNSTISTDVLHDLVFVSVTDVPKITRIRSIPSPGEWGVSQSKPRLFWSKKQLLLRRSGGFDVINLEGQVIGEYRPKNQGEFLGLNTQGKLVFFRNLPVPTISHLNMSSRDIREFAVKDIPGNVQYASAFFLDPMKIQLIVSVRSTATGAESSRQLVYWINPNTGKAVLQPEIKENGTR